MSLTFREVEDIFLGICGTTIDDTIASFFVSAIFLTCLPSSWNLIMQTCFETRVIFLASSLDIFQKANGLGLSDPTSTTLWRKLSDGNLFVCKH